MVFKLGKWYETERGDRVEFIIPIEKDGMYNVFRMGEECDYRAHYTDANGKTPYPGGSIVKECTE